MKLLHFDQLGLALDLFEEGLSLSEKAPFQSGLIRFCLFLLNLQFLFLLFICNNLTVFFCFAFIFLVKYVNLFHLCARQSDDIIEKGHDLRVVVAIRFKTELDSTFVHHVELVLAY